tara:strand:- start:4191 stop:5738 length:1548 start_codon:yes stop_codon:yes gene_type:complete
MPIIQIPVLFDVSGTMQIYGEDTQGQDFIESHLQFTLDMTTDPNYPLSYQDFANAILIGDADSSNNIFFANEAAGTHAIDFLCNKIALAITKGNLLHYPAAGDHSTAGIPMGGRPLVAKDGTVKVDADPLPTIVTGLEDNSANNIYSLKYQGTVSPVDGPQPLGPCILRTCATHLVGHPLAQGLFVNEDNIQVQLETNTANQFGTNFYYNSIAEQLSKVFGGGLTTASQQLNPGLVDRVIQGGGNTTTTTLVIANTNTKKKIKVTFSGTWLAGDTITQTITSAIDPNNKITHTITITENKTDVQIASEFPASTAHFTTNWSVASDYYEIEAVANNDDFTYTFSHSRTEGQNLGILKSEGRSNNALQSIYEQLVQIPNRALLTIGAKDLSGADILKTTCCEMPFVAGDFIIFFLRPKLHLSYEAVDATAESIQGFLATGDPSGIVHDISGLTVSSAVIGANIGASIPGKVNAGNKTESEKFCWMGSSNADSLTLETTNDKSPNVFDAHVWKIKIKL